MENNIYKEHFKLYKSGGKPEDGSCVLDLKDDVFDEEQVNIIKVSSSGTDYFPYLIPSDKWKVYEIKQCPGLIYVRNPFTSSGHRYWTVRCLRDYPKPPNKRNIDVHTKNDNEKDWVDLKGIKDLHRLRWTTFGYHHNWDTKVYDENSKSTFPEDLGHLCKYMGKFLDFTHFNPEAAIVNYYPLNSTLYGHQDVSENDFKAPIFSLSFGQSAIFLIGKDLQTKPTALYLHSGDLVIMSKESRLYVHGVPKIVAKSEEKWNELAEDSIKTDYPSSFQKDIVRELNDKEFWSFYDKYLKTTRINVNIRQVLKRGQKRLLERENNE